MLDRVNWGYHQKVLGSSYLSEESSHTKCLTRSTFPSCKKVCGGGGWWVVGVKVDFSVKL